jgi:hypothetical protein
VRGHPTAIAARAAVVGARAVLDDRLAELRGDGHLMEAALAEAVYQTVTGNSAHAAGLILAALEGAPEGSSAWGFAIDPCLNVGAHATDWDAVLTLLSRAA